MKNYRVFIFLILCIALCTATVAGLVFSPSVYTTATEIKVELDESTAYTAYGDVFVHTNKDNSLILSTPEGKFELKKAFDGKCISIAMNGEYVFILSQLAVDDSNHIYFNAYSYSAQKTTLSQAVNALSVFGVSSYDIENNTYLINPNKYGIGGMDKLYINGNKLYVVSCADNLYDGETKDVMLIADLLAMTIERPITNLDLAKASDFVVVDNTVYFLRDNDLLSSQIINFNTPEVKKENISAISLTLCNDVLFANCKDGVYAIDRYTFATKKVLDNNFDGKINFLQNGSDCYLLLHDTIDKSVKQYLVKGNFADCELVYYNSFDNIIYSDPAIFDIIKVGKAQSNTNAYYSPKNMKVEFTLAKDEYILVLAKQDGYYFVRNNDGSTAYINEKDLTLLQASTDTDMGKYAQALHNNTKIYKYPYTSNDVVATVGKTDLLIVVDNVASDNGVQVWDWYKVCIIGNDNSLTYGYIQKDYTSEYSNYQLPTFSADATVSSGELGMQVNVHLLPDESSEVLGTLSDGQKVVLAQEKLDSNSQWTKVVYGDMEGYIKTANLTTNSITGIQSALLVILGVVIIATIIVVTLVIKKRNSNKY